MPARAEEAALLHAAGSLRAPLSEVAKVFETATSRRVTATFGAPTDRVVYGALLAADKADIFLGYCTQARVAILENPGQTMIELPDAIAVGADYGLTVMDGAGVAAYRLAMFILSSEGQAILIRHGFQATLPLGS